MLTVNEMKIKTAEKWLRNAQILARRDGDADSQLICDWMGKISAEMERAADEGKWYARISENASGAEDLSDIQEGFTQYFKAYGYDVSLAPVSGDEISIRVSWDR